MQRQHKQLKKTQTAQQSARLMKLLRRC